MARRRLFRLIVDGLTASGRFNLRLTDGEGNFLAAQEVQVEPGLSQWRGLFEMDRYLRVEEARGVSTEDLMSELGGFLRAEVLGHQIAAELFGSRLPGVLFVELPGDLRPEVLELSRVPWEIAQDDKRRSLLDVNLAVQVVPRGAMSGDAALENLLATARPLGLDAPLRILVAFAQSRGQATLAMRRMRERLRVLLLRDIGTRCQVEVEILQYGVTRAALQRVRHRAGGFHIVHLFAHGMANQVVLEDEEGRDDLVSGEELAEILTGDFTAPPYLVFLTACHSGEVEVREAMAAVLGALGPGNAQAGTEGDADGDAQLSHSAGTALALLRSEVPLVVAMRYSVEEKFAFDLAEAFYRRVLLDQMPPVSALGSFQVWARDEATNQGYPYQSWATPVLFGGVEGSQPIVLVAGRSGAADRLWPRGRLPAELHPVPVFVGRSDKLRELHRHVFGVEPDKTVALIWGIGGMGKTAMAAEAIGVWQASFEFTFGARPSAAGEPLSLSAWLAEIEYFAVRELGETALLVWDEQRDMPRETWLEARLSELVRLLNTHRILLILDGFDANLRREGESAKERYVCADPEWGAALSRLARDLVPAMSRLLLTSRWAPAELSHAESVLCIPVGVLQPSEWGVFVRSAPNLGRLLSGSEEQRSLVARVLSVARGHPYILRALEHLAAEPEELARRLDEFEARGGTYGDMGDLIVRARAPEERQRELAYLEEIALRSTHALVEGCSPAAQRLLRVMTIALESVSDELITHIWENEHWPEEMPRLQPLGQDWRDPLDELLAKGLVTRERQHAIDPEGKRREMVRYVWHPIVAEQVGELLPDGPDFPERDYLRRYAECHRGNFFARRQRGDSRLQALAIGAAGHLAVRYFLRLGDDEEAAAGIGAIRDFPVGTSLRRRKEGWMMELLDRLGPGEALEQLLLSFADFRIKEGRPRLAVPYCRRALESATDRGDLQARASANHSLGGALRCTGELTAAREAFCESLRLGRQGSRSYSGRLMTMLELLGLRVHEIGRGGVARLRGHAARLADLAQAHYERRSTAQAEEEADEVVSAGDLLIRALSVQTQVELAGEEYASAIKLYDRWIDLLVRHHHSDPAIAETAYGRAAALARLGNFDDAEQALVECLTVYQQHQHLDGEANVLGELANVALRRGELDRAEGFAAQALKIRHRLGSLRAAASSHHSLSIILADQGRLHDAVLEAACAAVIRAIAGSSERLERSLALLSVLARHLEHAGQDVLRPTAQELFQAYPQLAEALAAHGITPEKAQEQLDGIWPAGPGGPAPR